MRTAKIHRPLRLRNSDGFTLTELMIALVIMAVGILSVGRMFIFAKDHAAYGRQETRAVALAEEIREKIMSDNFDDLITIFDGVDTDNPSSLTTPCQTWAQHLEDNLGGVSGRGQIQVLDETQDPEIVAGMVTVVLTISWQEAGKTEAVDMRFSVSKMGL
jgi:prepilin-type N-terminal cleavage/methylation domain-containing protein